MNLKKSILLSMATIFMAVTSFSQTNPVGFYKYGGSGTWANHLSVSPDGTRLVMAGLATVGGMFGTSQPHFIEVTTAGDVVFSRQVGTDGGEMFSSITDGNGDLYLGGAGGDLGNQSKYIVKYNGSMSQVFANDYGEGQIRYLIKDGASIVATGF